MAIDQSVRDTVNTAFASVIDKNLLSIVSKSLGPTVDVQKAALLASALKNSIRSKLGNKLGIDGGVASGTIGGSAGGGKTLELGTGLPAGYAGGVGKALGVPTGELSLGAGLGTRASRPGTAGGPVNLGNSNSGSFGVGAQVGFSDEDPKITAKTKVTVNDEVVQEWEKTLLELDLPPSERLEFSRDFTPDINAAIKDAFDSAFGPGLSYPSARGVALLNAEVTMQAHGPWKATVEIDEVEEGEPLPAGLFVFDVDGVEFRGTVDVDRSSAWGGRTRVRVVGGSGGLYNQLPARNYSGGLTRAKTVLDDILRDSGETLSSLVDPDLLNIKFSGWQRVESKTTESLDQLCKKLDCEWRVLRDGKIWIGKDEWPDVEPAGIVMETDAGAGVVAVAPEFPTLVPGIRVRNQQVRQIVYKVGRTGTTAELYNRGTSDLLTNIINRATKGTEYDKRYRCEVVTQNSDGTVDVLVDDQRMKGRGIGKCRVRVGIPGTKLTVPKGARCLVGWDDGDPSLPYVDSWESSTAATLVEVGDNPVAVALAGGTVQALLPPTLMITGTVTPGPPPAPAAAFVGFITIPQPLVGVIQGGSAKLKA